MKVQIGGSPCTHWSIAQTKNRETEPKGLGWDLFENYLIALYKFQPDYFLYENNKSMPQAIRAEITKRFGFEPICINSALVSAQNRQRLYWCGRRNQDGTYRRVDVPQPEDRGILLRDILDTGFAVREKAYALLTPRGGTTAEDAFARRQRNVAAEPVRVGTIESETSGEKWDSKQYRVYSPDRKSVTLCGQGGGVGEKTGLYAVPAGMAWRGHARNGNSSSFEMRSDGKSNAVIVGHQNRLVIENADGKTVPVYEVRNGIITIKGKQYPIKLADGYYIIRKLTVLECMRLQTIPESYVFPVSDTQAYKMLGNGWTVDVISHLMSHFDGIITEPLDVLSMYDGMACGHIALDKLGAHISRYRATEIDKYAIKTAHHNFPDIEQLGDAFQVRFWV